MKLKPRQHITSLRSAPSPSGPACQGTAPPTENGHFGRETESPAVPPGHRAPRWNKLRSSQGLSRGGGSGAPIWQGKKSNAGTPERSCPMARGASHLRGKRILTNLRSLLLPMSAPKGFRLLHEMPGETPRAVKPMKGDASKNVLLTNDLEKCR